MPSVSAREQVVVYEDTCVRPSTCCRTVGTDAEAEHAVRTRAFARLSAVLRRAVCDLKGDGDAVDTDVFALWPTGSYALGACCADSDVDAVLVVAERFAVAEDVRGGVLEALQREPSITEVVDINAASVPIVTFFMAIDGRSINFDLSFASVPWATVPAHATALDDAAVAELEGAAQASINAARLPHTLLSLVPDAQTYLSALLIVKRWAKARQVYASKLGYFGGVTWAILVAKAAALYPSDTTAELAAHFFKIFSNWRWDMPVWVQAGAGNSPRTTGAAGDAWERDWASLCWVLTPTVPAFNTTRSVTSSGLEVTAAEIRRAAALVGHASACDETAWAELAGDDGMAFRFYVRVACQGPPHALPSWRGTVEMNIRPMVMAVEATGVCLRPFTRREDSEAGGAAFVIGVAPRVRKDSGWRPYAVEVVQAWVDALAAVAPHECSVTGKVLLHKDLTTLRSRRVDYKALEGNRKRGRSPTDVAATTTVAALPPPSPKTIAIEGGAATCAGTVVVTGDAATPRAVAATTTATVAHAKAAKAPAPCSPAVSSARRKDLAIKRRDAVLLALGAGAVAAGGSSGGGEGKKLADENVDPQRGELRGDHCGESQRLAAAQGVGLAVAQYAVVEC